MSSVMIHRMLGCLGGASAEMAGPAYMPNIAHPSSMGSTRREFEQRKREANMGGRALRGSKGVNSPPPRLLVARRLVQRWGFNWARGWLKMFVPASHASARHC